MDVDGDGFKDIVVAPHPGDPMYWYENPRGANTHWASHEITPAGVAGLETPIVVDVFGDGRPRLVMSDAVEQSLGWYEPPADPRQPWTQMSISGPRFPGAGLFVHGIGLGDVDGDGKLDVLTGYGWYQQTSVHGTWVSHPFSFGPNLCSRMFAYDVDGDGLADVLCGNPHDYGLHYWKQARATNGADLTFTEYPIDDSISQLHALRLDDLDGDGVPEIITGKRWLAHTQIRDPGDADPAVLTFFKLRRRVGGAVTFERHDVDEDSGVGTQFAVGDVDGDRKADIVTSNKKGLFLFHQR